MDWREQHAQRIESFPSNVRDAYRHSSGHEAELRASRACGCFQCLAVFPPTAIENWIGDAGGAEGRTALCPACGVDAVIGDAAGFPIGRPFLKLMSSYWFSTAGEARPGRRAFWLGVALLLVAGAFGVKQSVERNRLRAKLAEVNGELAKYQAIVDQIERVPPEQARVLSRVKPEYERVLKEKRDLEAALGHRARR
jgi:hypothetical protein